MPPQTRQWYIFFAVFYYTNVYMQLLIDLVYNQRQRRPMRAAAAALAGARDAMRLELVCFFIVFFYFIY
jgi:hypothetical protein